MKDFKEFTSALVPTNKRRVEGITIPALKIKAKFLVKEEGWQNFLNNVLEEALLDSDSISYEDVILAGLVIDYVKIPFTDRWNYVNRYLKIVDNWAACDVFCCNAKWVIKERELVLEQIPKLLVSKDEFVIRSGIIFLMSYYLHEEYAEKVFSLLNRFVEDNKNIAIGYYLDMGLAWFIATAAVKLFNHTLQFWREAPLNESVRKMTLQKLRDSKRINDKEYEQFRFSKPC